MLKRASILHNEKGMAVMELIPTLLIYVFVINFSLGFFGAVHAGILHNIAARNYTFETLRHRPNVVYHRVYDQDNNYAKTGYRFSGIIYDNVKSSSERAWTAPARPIAFTSAFGGTDNINGLNISARGPAGEPNAKANHNQNVRNLNESVRNDKVSVATIWIKSLYGICINSTCGD